MSQMPVYQYTIPLEQTEDGFKPTYKYPEENVINKYEKGGEPDSHSGQGRSTLPQGLNRCEGRRACGRWG